MRKALIVGIDYYESKHVNDLFGCVNDAQNVCEVLKNNGDGTKNFDHVEPLKANEPKSSVSRKLLKDNILELFRGKSEIALFYFAGHGHIESTGGYLLSSECKHGDAGLPMNELLNIVHKSKVQNKIIILDCCHSGVAGNIPTEQDKAIISDGMTILAASSLDQYAGEENGSGVFTTLLIDALNGSAADLVGQISPGSVYAHIDQAMGYWGQRPIFKTNVEKFTTLRKVQAAIELADLRKLTSLFTCKEEYFQLNPTFEPERSDEQKSEYPDPIKENTVKFDILQKYNRINLVVPVDAPHMWHAAVYSKSCKLTALGQHYWTLVKKGII